MRLFHATFRLSLIPVGILILGSYSTAAAQQDTVLPLDRAAVNQALHDCNVALQRKDYQAMVQCGQKATTLDPRNVTGWFYVARAYEMLGQFPEAEQAARTLVSINPNYLSAHNNLGVILMKEGRADEAIAEYRKQLELEPQNRYASFNLARLLASRGQWDEARELAAIAAPVAPQDSSRWYFLGKAQMQTKHFDDARQSFDRALTHPHDPIMENNIAYDLADAGLDLDKSWNMVSAVLAQTALPACEPESLADGDKCTTQLRKMAYMVDTAGWTLYRQGKPAEEVEPYLRSAFAINPDAGNRLHMAVLMAKTGHVEDAVRAFAEGRTLPGFRTIDTAETLRELAKAAGGEQQLDALLDRAPAPPSPAVEPAKVIVLVDANGKVLEARAVAPAPASLAEKAKSLTLAALAWPGHALRSIRSIEFTPDGDDWTPALSYVGTTPPPPPCGPPAKPATTLLTQISGREKPTGCSAL